MVLPAIGPFPNAKEGRQSMSIAFTDNEQIQAVREIGLHVDLLLQLLFTQARVAWQSILKCFIRSGCSL